MKIKWWGHASFLLTDDRGVRIITDPYGDELPYKRISDEADIVTISHEHYDHNKAEVVGGNPEIIRSTGTFTVEDIRITGIPTKHDKNEGRDRGDNIIFLFEFAGKRIAHLGDLGHIPDAEALEQLADLDILMLPVGGTYTINSEEAYEICQKIKPALIVPMHYKTDILEFDITRLDNFTRFFAEDQIYRVDSAEVDTDSIPTGKEVLVLDYVR
ncbi:MAG: MBL fold metallo-hydrolase [Halanaerobiaceae bacterium]|nr:MBL fold metallo-hydrolase [Halanaerobiaceae bacterium]